MAHRSGFVNIIGNPNVGKSTLMNQLVGEKLSIITSKAQTTRHRIMGIVNGEDFQTIADIAAQIEGEEITTSKVTYRLNALAKDGYAEKADVQIPATEGVKARVVKAYRVAPQA